MPERDVGTVLAYSLSRSWAVLMLHLLPEEHKTNCGTDLTDREGFREGEGVIWGSQDERRPNPTKEPDPHSQRTERDSERGEGVIWVNWRGGTGG